jgi:hypothetical protein
MKNLHMSPSDVDILRMRRLLNIVEKSLQNARRFSKKKRMYGCERTLLHMISHALTLGESLKSKKPGFA